MRSTGNACSRSSVTGWGSGRPRLTAGGGTPGKSSTHEAAGLRDRGLAGSLAWDPPPPTDRGLNLTLSQTFGAGRLAARTRCWRDTLEGLATNDSPALPVTNWPPRTRMTP